ncbi:MAG: co-chaperone GroES [Acidobacteria bacterium]|nr:co-chaperone GroES [Acidobacteriota bacterium]
MSSMRPLQDRVLIKRIISNKEESKGGIVIPDTAKEKPQEGEVIAVGNGKTLDNGTKLKLEVKVGDRILFAKYAGTEVKIDDREFLIMREEEILGIISAGAKSKSAAV